MITISRMLCALVVAVAVTGCANDGGRRQVGGAYGSAVGGLHGSVIGRDKEQLAPTAAGTLLGGYLGSEVGKSLDRVDRPHAEEAAQNSLGASPDGQTSRWSNPDTGHDGTFTPINAYLSADDFLCRDYNQSVTVDGQTQDAYGTACLDYHGSWRVVEIPIRPGVLRRRSTARRRR